MSHEDGWISWMRCSPSIGDAPVLIMRDGWGSPSIICRDEMRPEMDVSSLYWRRTGIYRERQAAMPRKSGQQENSATSMNWSSILGDNFIQFHMGASAGGR